MIFWPSSVELQHIAIIDADSGKSLSYGQLSDSVARLAEVFGVERQLVAIWAENNLECVVTYLGALAGGHAVALLDGTNDHTLRQEWKAAYLPNWVWESGHLSRLNTDQPPMDQELALLLSTSGSLGAPKMVRLSGAGIRANASDIRDALGISASSRAVLSLPLSYSYGLSILHSHLVAGASVLLTSRSLISKEYWSDFHNWNCDGLAGVPHHWRTILRLGLDSLPLHAGMSFTQAGGFLGVEEKEKILAWCQIQDSRFHVMYGQTEATARIAVATMAHLQQDITTVGRTLGSGAVSFGDDQELIYQGPNVMLGYAASWGDLANGDQLNGRLHTGDLGFMKDGLIYLTGRKSRFVKIDGQRFALDRLEDLLSATLKKPVATLSIDDQIHLFFQGVETSDDIKSILRSFGLRQAYYQVHHLSELPRSQNGKVSTSQLMKFLESRR